MQVNEQQGVTSITISGSVGNFVEYTKVQAAFQTEDAKKYFSKVRETSLSRTKDKNGEKVLFGMSLIATPELLKLDDTK